MPLVESTTRSKHDLSSVSAATAVINANNESAQRIATLAQLDRPFMFDGGVQQPVWCTMVCKCFLLGPVLLEEIVGLLLAVGTIISIAANIRSPRLSSGAYRGKPSPFLARQRPSFLARQRPWWWFPSPSPPFGTNYILYLHLPDM